MKMVIIAVKAFVEMMKVVNKDTESGGVMKDGLINVWWSLKKIVCNSIIQKQRGNLSVDFRHEKYLKNLSIGNLRNHQTMNLTSRFCGLESWEHWIFWKGQDVA